MPADKQKQLKRLNALKTNPQIVPIVQDEEKISQLAAIVDNLEKLGEKSTTMPEEPTMITVKGVKGDKGDDGKDGKTPTRDELLDLIEPLIPEPVPGKDGANGTTPVKGLDYFTEEEISEIKDEVVVDTVTLIESLEGDSRLDATKLKNNDIISKEQLSPFVEQIESLKKQISELESKLKSQPTQTRSLFGRLGGTAQQKGTQTDYYVDDVLYSGVEAVKFVSGSGINLSPTRSGNILTINYGVAISGQEFTFQDGTEYTFQDGAAYTF